MKSQAQLGNEFQIANRFMQQQNYEAALPIFKRLVKQNPGEYYFFDRLVECYIQLKQYDEALEAISSLNPTPNFQAQARVLEGQLYHFKHFLSGHQTWNRTPEICKSIFLQQIL